MSRHQRGAALPETALSLTLMLAVLVGGLRLAIVGYEQVAVDGAAFYDAHQTGIKETYPAVATALDPTAATQDAYPRTNQASVTIVPTSPQPAPTVGVPTNYGVLNTTDRHGGTSLLQPLQQMSLVTNSSIDSISPFTGGSVLSVTGYGVDPAYLETGSHYDVNGDDFNAGGATTNAVDYFSQGENVPPYFVGFSYMTYCPLPYDSLTSSWDSCTQGVSYRALGLAEFLDTSNWSRAQPGETPAGDGGPALGGVFWETVYHHDVYARISQALPGDIATPGNLHLAQEVLDWNTNNGSGGAAQAMYNLSCASTIGDPCNGDILKVYSWDAVRIPGGVPNGYVFNSNPLQPAAGYPAQ